MFIIDAHLDLAMNAMEWNRDLRKSIEQIRAREKGMNDKPDRGNATVSLPELRQANIGLVVATQIARWVDDNSPLPGWYSPEQAWAQTQAQLAWYKQMEACGEMRMVKDLASLESHLANWNDGSGAGKPIGFILSLEGADSLVSVDYLYTAFGYGLRAVGPAHYGPGRYANGTDSSGHLSEKGKELLRAMQELKMILDVTHLCDDAFFDAMDLYDAPLWASHHNSRALVPHNRQLSDEMIQLLIQKNAVIGVALDAWMLVPGWVRGSSTPKGTNCSLETVANHIDHICQLAGNTLHAGIGTDLDGAFGTEQTAWDVNTIADIAKLENILAARGYTAVDITNIFHGNFLRFMRKALAAF